MANNRAMKTATFNSVKGRYVKLEVIKSAGGFASAADISLYSN